MSGDPELVLFARRFAGAKQAQQHGHCAMKSSTELLNEVIFLFGGIESTMSTRWGGKWRKPRRGHAGKTALDTSER